MYVSTRLVFRYYRFVFSRVAKCKTLRCFFTRNDRERLYRTKRRRMATPTAVSRPLVLCGAQTETLTVAVGSVIKQCHLTLSALTVWIIVIDFQCRSNRVLLDTLLYTFEVLSLSKTRYNIIGLAVGPFSVHTGSL